ncbi:MAG TPA: hypothetical protein GX715_11380 [Armatimonadetes bacterium]|nr:hypothetical protein [Armatimonadota bacterium]
MADWRWARGLLAGAVAVLAPLLLGCHDSSNNRVEETHSGPRQVELQTHLEWSEGSTQLYAIIGAGWPPSGLQRTSWQEGTNYSIEPRVSIKSVRLLDDGMTLCLTTAEQAPGTRYQVRYTPKVSFPAPPLEGFPQNPVLTAVAVDATHVVVVPDTHHQERVDWADASSYRFEPPLAVHSAQVSADGRLVRLTTAEQEASASYKLRVGGIATPIVR